MAGQLCVICADALQDGRHIVCAPFENHERHGMCDECVINHVQHVSTAQLTENAGRVPCPGSNNEDKHYHGPAFSDDDIALVFVRRGEVRRLADYLSRALPQRGQEEAAGGVGAGEDVAQYLRQIEDLMNVRCPNRDCNSVLDPTPDGCSAMNCPGCGIGFCWVCFQRGDRNEDMHAHARRVHGDFFFTRELLLQHWPRIFQGRLVEYVATIPADVRRAVVLQANELQDLRDWNIRLPIPPQPDEPLPIPPQPEPPFPILQRAVGNALRCAGRAGANVLPRGAVGNARRCAVRAANVLPRGAVGNARRHFLRPVRPRAANAQPRAAIPVRWILLQVFLLLRFLFGGWWRVSAAIADYIDSFGRSFLSKAIANPRPACTISALIAAYGLAFGGPAALMVTIYEVVWRIFTLLAPMLWSATAFALKKFLSLGPATVAACRTARMSVLGPVAWSAMAFSVKAIYWALFHSIAILPFLGRMTWTAGRMAMSVLVPIVWPVALFALKAILLAVLALPILGGVLVLWWYIVVLMSSCVGFVIARLAFPFVWLIHGDWERTKHQVSLQIKDTISHSLRVKFVAPVRRVYCPAFLSAVREKAVEVMEFILFG